MGKLSPPQHDCPVCGNAATDRHCPSIRCQWFRCDKDKCATIFNEARRYIRNTVRT